VRAFEEVEPRPLPVEARRGPSEPAERSDGGIAARDPGRSENRRSSLRRALSTPSGLRRAVLLREVLGPPLALRDEAHGTTAGRDGLEPG
jgi:hypothetical protein